MNRRIAVLLVLIGMILPVRIAVAAPDIGEGYVKPTFQELIQTAVLLRGFDLNNIKIADEYARIVYCDLYQKNFSNDIVWRKIREQISARAQKKKEYFRVKYEVISTFTLGRYDFSKQYFPLEAKDAITNVGNISLLKLALSTDCMGRDLRSPIFPPTVTVQLNDPLTVTGFYAPPSKVEKMMVRIEEAGNLNRKIYGRLRLIITDAVPGITVSNNLPEMVLKGKVTSVDFFIDSGLTKPLGGVQFGHE